MIVAALVMVVTDFQSLVEPGLKLKIYITKTSGISLSCSLHWEIHLG